MAGSVRVSVTVNGAEQSAEVEPRLLLVHFLRETLGLTGTHVGCDTSNCGACTVHLNGEAVKSCTLLAAQADGAEGTTIEGMGTDGSLHPRQAAVWGPRGSTRCPSRGPATSPPARATTTSSRRCRPRRRRAFPHDRRRAAAHHRQ